MERGIVEHRGDVNSNLRRLGPRLYEVVSVFRDWYLAMQLGRPNSKTPEHVSRARGRFGAAESCWP